MGMREFGAKQDAAARWKKDLVILKVEDATYTNKEGKLVVGRRFKGSILLPSGEPANFEIYQREGQKIVNLKSDEKGNVVDEIIFLNLSIKIKGGL